MSTEITVRCPDCWYNGQQEIGNDWFDNKYPFCPGCCKDLTFNPNTNDYR